MHPHRSMTAQRLTAWIAALAILVAALMPAITQAAASGDQRWLEVCTVSGVERIAVDTNPDTQGDRRNAGGMTCPWCYLHAGLPVVLAAASVSPTDYGSSRIYTVREQHVPRSYANTTSARPRAPPPCA